MTGPQVLVREERTHGSKTPPLSPSAEAAWSFLGLIGAVFFLIGSANQWLAFVPLMLGSPEWEFGTVSAYLDALPLPALGATLFMASGIALGRRWMVRTGSVIIVLMAVAILALVVVYATDIPLALKSVTDPTIRLGLKKAIVKALGQGLGYPLVFAVIAVKAWKVSRGSHSSASHA
jgi:hypothetical protein